MTTIAMWAHPRSISTAFLRMMIERGDTTVVHEPLVTLTDTGEVTLPGLLAGETVTLRSVGEVIAHLVALGKDRTVFFKDTLEYHYQHLFDHPAEIADIRHTFIVREPARTIASHYAAKPEVTCPEIGYQHQYDLFELAWRATGQRPTVISAERLVEAPAEVVAAYCAEVDVPFLPHALHWRSGDRDEWQRTRRWHLDAIRSSTFGLPANDYPVTVDNDEKLRSFYDCHRPYYERLIEHVL